MSQPSSTASSNERNVFSGASAAAPRWPTRANRPGGRRSSSDTLDDDDCAVVREHVVREVAAVGEHRLREILRGQLATRRDDRIEPFEAVELARSPRFEHAVGVEHDRTAGLERLPYLAVLL